MEGGEEGRGREVGGWKIKGVYRIGGDIVDAPQSGFRRCHEARCTTTKAIRKRQNEDAEQHKYPKSKTPQSHPISEKQPR